MTPEEANRLRAAARCIHQAEKNLGPLSRSERRDLLLDTLRWVRGWDHAGWILAAVEDMYPVLKGIGPAR